MSFRYFASKGRYPLYPSITLSLSLSEDHVRFLTFPQRAKKAESSSPLFVPKSRQGLRLSLLRGWRASSLAPQQHSETRILLKNPRSYTFRLINTSLIFNNSLIIKFYYP
ncbi:hypothetical protein [Coxiella burnetii]|uniref:Uncharacterized protein n=2 Tax=Coxiella burnetii TaxID=777 RepID=Q83BG8_COXBU|nr:hypothetical protein [Coxiella burnetii]NP_820523.1 hypothetical protein CBU_1540 [Coxiella burnetii RSA 493]AAO91037.1 hypothetical protein CBU_1540 [Coxiella burnetii RSA 493]ACI23103.1 hypothetical protein CBUD_0446b [Coxiella burnetii Dugway 5J108-111]ARI66306.1 hypothetical protein B7L74_07920 [Coxiella burnetii]ARK27760.1 hypothetical protein BMW92_07710 [Coxiella burnetii]ATN86472.1 hypothetical protein AYO29_08615 [Coxiella burnetii str. Schperling]